MADDLERMTVNLIPAAAEARDRSCERDRLSKTDITNRALQFYDRLAEEMKDGSTLALIRPDGSVDRVLIV